MGFPHNLYDSVIRIAQGTPIHCSSWYSKVTGKVPDIKDAYFSLLPGSAGQNLAAVLVVSLATHMA